MRRLTLRAFLFGVRVFFRQVKCHHTMVRADVTVQDGRIVPVRRCRDCGWTDINPLLW